MSIFTIIDKITPALRNILFGKEINQQDLIEVFLNQIQIDGYSFAHRIPFILNKPSDKDISKFFDGLCDKVEDFLKHEMNFKEIKFQDIRFGDQVIAAKVRVTFYEDLYLVGIVYFLERESYDMWKPLVSPNDLDFIFKHKKLPEYVKYPKNIPLTFSGIFGNLPKLEDKDFAYCKEFFFKVV